MSDQAFIFWFIVLGAIAFGSFVHFGFIDRQRNDVPAGGRNQGEDEDG